MVYLDSKEEQTLKTTEPPSGSINLPFSTVIVNGIWITGLERNTRA